MTRLTTRKKTCDSGFVTIEFIAGVAFLMLPCMLLVTVVPTWAERQSMARAAAQEASRVYTLQNSQIAAQEIVDTIATNHGLKSDQMKLSLSGNPRQRGGEVTATVEVKVPVTIIPILDANHDAFSFSESHTEIVDLYRSLPQQ